MREVDESAFADMMRVIDETAAAMPDGLEYITVSRYMPASTVLVGRDEQGRLYALASEEFIDSIPAGPFTGSPLTALVGIPIVRLVAVKD